MKVDPDKKLAVLIADTSVQLADVSLVQPFERTFWARFDTALDFGYSMTRTNSAKQLSLGANLTYRDERYVDVIFANIFSSSQENAPETQRWDVANDFRRLLGSRWYANTTQEFLNSEEQGLDLRTTIGGGGGRYLLRSASQDLALGGGLASTNENYTDPALETKDSAEAYIGSEFMTEKLKITDLITRFTWYPSLTIDDRYRLAFRFDLDFNLPGDWYFRVGFFDNYDSLPPERIFQQRLRLVERIRLQVLRTIASQATTSGRSVSAAALGTLRASGSTWTRRSTAPLNPAFNFQTFLIPC